MSMTLNDHRGALLATAQAFADACTSEALRRTSGVDDFILLHESPAWLSSAHRDIEAWLPEQLHCRLNPRKTILQPVSRGVDFVGHVIKPWRRTARRDTAARAVQRLQALQGSADRKAVRQRANSYLGLLRQASHSHHDRARLANAVRDLGHSINGTFTKAYA